MKTTYFLIILIFFQSCSFDNKTGIWESESESVKKKDQFKEFKTLSSRKDPFSKTIKIDDNFIFNIQNHIENKNWTDEFFQQNNNFANFKYENLQLQKFKSRKITNNEINKHILYDGNKFVINDLKGNIIIFSDDENKIITEFNFYRKKHKKVKKLLNLIIENNVIYVSDNIGYLYAFDYEEEKLLWAKDYKVPFKSNLKISEDNLIATNQNNNLFFFNKRDGTVLKLIPTEETIVKNEFVNNLSMSSKYLFFLNTYGTLYSIDRKSRQIIWFLNINQSLDLNPSNLFFGSKIINNEEVLAVSSNDFFYIIDVRTGSIKFRKNFSSKIKPLIIENYIFIVTKKNFLVCLNLEDGKIIYSYNIEKKISDYLNSKKKSLNINSLFIANNDIIIFLDSSFVLKFTLGGNLKKVDKLISKINSNPIFVKKSLVFIDRSKKLIISN